MNRILDRILNLGVQETDKVVDRLSIRQFNRYLLFVLAFIPLSLIVGHFCFPVESAYMNRWIGGLIGVLFICFYLMSKHKIYLAHLIFLYFIFAFIFFNSSFYGKGSGVHFYLIFAGVLCITFLKKKFWLYISLFVILALTGLLAFTNFNIFNIDQSFSQYNTVLFNTSLFTVISITAAFFLINKNDFRKNYEELEANKVRKEALEQKHLKTLEALKDNEQKYRAIFEHSGFGILIGDLQNSKALHFNDSFREIIGASDDEINAGNTITFSPEYQPDGQKSQEKITALIKEFKTQKKTITYEWQFQQPNGNLIDTSVTLTPLHPGEHNIIVQLVQNITERKKVENDLIKSEKHFRNFFVHSPLSIGIRDLDTKKLTLVNKQMANMLGYDSPEDVQNNSSARFTQYENQEYRLLMEEKLMRGEIASFHNEKQYIRKDGTIFWAEIYRSLLTLNEVTYIIGFMRDISVQKEAELALDQKMLELNAKNQELKKYIESNMQLENFAYIASHDLKEPLRTITSFSQLLQKRYKDQLDETGIEFLDFIVSATKNMNRLISDLLTYSRANEENHNISEIDLEDLLLATIQALKANMQEHNASILYHDTPPIIFGDYTKLRQLFQNLIANAIKFRKPGTNPVIDIRCTEYDQHYQFEISDNGIGISPEFHEKIFLLFKKLHNRTNYEGTGIGLALCKKIVDQHKGKIWLESEEGKGTCFFFTITKQISN